MTSPRAIALFFLTTLALVGAVPERVPVHKEQQIVVASADSGTWPYLAFPALLDRGE